MSEKDGRTAVQEVLLLGLVDWVYEASVYTVAIERLRPVQSAVGDQLSDTQLGRDEAIGIIAEVLMGGLMVAGDIVDQSHHPWEMSPRDALARITLEWERWGNEVPTPGAVVWLALTANGREEAEALSGT